MRNHPITGEHFKTQGKARDIYPLGNQFVLPSYRFNSRQNSYFTRDALDQSILNIRFSGPGKRSVANKMSTAGSALNVNLSQNHASGDVSVNGALPHHPIFSC